MRPITYAITEGRAVDLNFEQSSNAIVEQARMLSDLGVSHFQIREKNLSASNLYKLSVNVANVLRDTETQLLINDRADIAVAIGAYGVHLATNSMPAKLVRQTFGSRVSIFVSTHNTDEVYKAIEAEAEAAVFGPIFSTPGKSDLIGIRTLETVVSDATVFPIIALGGIDHNNCRSVIEAGAAGVAGIRCFADRGDAGKLMEALRSSE